MKEVSKWSPNYEKKVNAYQKKDLDNIRPVLKEAERIWYDEWVRQGCTDNGTCCGGKGIQIWYLKPRGRSAQETTVINCPPVQGNQSAYASVQPALDFLKSQDIESWYYDGWMD